MSNLVGVGLLLFKGDTVYVIQELVRKSSDFSKKPGDFSIPMETLEEGESHEQGITRLLKEEVDDTNSIQITKPLYIGHCSYTGTKHATQAHLYVSWLQHWDGRDFSGSHVGIEYLPYGFISQAELLKKGRQGMEDILRLVELYAEF